MQRYHPNRGDKALLERVPRGPDAVTRGCTARAGLLGRICGVLCAPETGTEQKGPQRTERCTCTCSCTCSCNLFLYLFLYFACTLKQWHVATADSTRRVRSKYRYQRIDPPCSAVPAGSNHSASGGTCRRRLCPPTAALPAQVPVLAALALAWLQAPAQRGPPPENWPVESQAPWPWATRLRLGSPPLLALPFGLLPGVRLAQNKPPLRTLRSSRLPPLLFQTSHLPLPQAAFSFSPFHLITPLSLFLIFFSPVLCRALAQRLCSRLSLALDLPQTSPPIPGSRTGAHSPLVFPLARCLHCRSDPASLRPLRRPQQHQPPSQAPRSAQRHPNPATATAWALRQHAHSHRPTICLPRSSLVPSLFAPIAHHYSSPTSTSR